MLGGAKKGAGSPAPGSGAGSPAPGGGAGSPYRHFYGLLKT